MFQDPYAPAKPKTARRRSRALSLGGCQWSRPGAPPVVATWASSWWARCAYPLMVDGFRRPHRGMSGCCWVDGVRSPSLQDFASRRHPPRRLLAITARNIATRASSSIVSPWKSCTDFAVRLLWPWLIRPVGIGHRRVVDEDVDVVLGSEQSADVALQNEVGLRTSFDRFFYVGIGTVSQVAHRVAELSLPVR